MFRKSSPGDGTSCTLDNYCVWSRTSECSTGGEICYLRLICLPLKQVYNHISRYNVHFTFQKVAVHSMIIWHKLSLIVLSHKDVNRSTRRAICWRTCVLVWTVPLRSSHILGHIVHILQRMSLDKSLHMWLVWTLPLNNVASNVFSRTWSNLSRDMRPSVKAL